jgi:hypothetical protein
MLALLIASYLPLMSVLYNQASKREMSVLMGLFTVFRKAGHQSNHSECVSARFTDENPSWLSQVSERCLFLVLN